MRHAIHLTSRGWLAVENLERGPDESLIAWVGEAPWPYFLARSEWLGYSPASNLINAAASSGKRRTKRSKSGASPGGKEFSVSPKDRVIEDWFKHTDLGNAERLAKRSEGKLLWVKGIGWLYWDGKRWDTAVTGEEIREATRMVREIYAHAARYNELAAKTEDESDRKLASDRAKSLSSWARTCESREKIKAAVDLGRSRPSLVGRVGDLDADGISLNVANGILDLDTLKLKDHDPAARHTKVTRGAYKESARSKRWEAFLKRILPDEETRRWMQKMVGYSLVGQYSEYLPILWGTGKNGKSVFLRTVRNALGDYASDAAPGLLEEKRSASAGDESAIASLRGQRFITSIETSEGKRLDEKTVKRLTGESEITAKFMKQDHIRFPNQTAVFMATNHKPLIEGTDNAIWERVPLIPFTEWIPPNERDEDLGKKLDREADAILAWAIEGLRMSRDEGMALPPAISEATGTYKDEMDRLSDWFSDCCILSPAAVTPIRWINDSYADHCKNAGVRVPLGPKAFNLQLEGRGLLRKKTRIDGKQVKVWVGIDLVDRATREAAQELLK